MSSTKFLSLGLACSVCSTKRMYSAGSGTLQADGSQSDWGGHTTECRSQLVRLALHSRLAVWVCSCRRVPNPQH